jgi:Protein of unknown function (DUF541)
MKTKTKPTMTVHNTIKRHRDTTAIAIRVDLEATSRDRHEAYLSYEKLVEKLNLIITELGDTIMNSKIDIPLETTRTTDDHKPKIETTVSGTATLRVHPDCNVGSLMCSLIEADMSFGKPSIEYADEQEISPEMYEDLAAGAREKASAAARGAGARLGSVVAINFPQNKALEEKRPFSDWFFRDRSPYISFNDSSAYHASWLINRQKPQTTPLNPRVFEFLEAEVTTRSDEFSISVTYELENDEV